jgi:DNA-binding transcriptional MerR regulator
MTIDELARASGMTVRNIRAHQANGLLPPPMVRRRTGYYGQDHLDRVRLIVDLQTEGMHLRAIKRLLDATPAGAAGEALSLRRAVLEPWEEEEPAVMTAEDLAERFGGADPALLARAAKLGIVVHLGDGRYEVPSPSLLAVAEELVAMGLPLGSILEVQDRLARATDTIARAFVGLVEPQLWQPSGGSGEPPDWSRVQEIAEKSRPLAGRATMANFRRSMSRAVEQTVNRDISAMSRGALPEGRGWPRKRRRRRPKA